jgi:hypothetical protein
MLAEEISDKHQVLGLTSDQEEKVEQYKKKREKMIKQILNENEESFYKTQDYSHGDVGVPMLTLELTNAPSNVKNIQ